jgi:FMN phosphatase YigB (HAD superfamily)
VYIGDEMATDIRGARSSGIRTVLITREDLLRPTEDSPDHVVHSLAEFRQLIKKISMKC